MVQLVCHTIVVLALVAAYVVLTVLGHDGNAILGLLVGYLGGVGSVAAIDKAEQTRKP